jgi:hypothetical protein
VEELRRSIRSCQRSQDYIHRVGEQGAGGALRDLSVRIGGEDGKQLDPLCRLERRGARADGELPRTARVARADLLAKLRINGALRKIFSAPCG